MIATQYTLKEPTVENVGIPQASMMGNTLITQVTLVALSLELVINPEGIAVIFIRMPILLISEL